MGKRDKAWDICLPCLKDFNAKRRSLLQSVIDLKLDKSMSNWRPKSSKLY